MPQGSSSGSVCSSPIDVGVKSQILNIVYEPLSNLAPLLPLQPALSRPAPGPLGFF